MDQEPLGLSRRLTDLLTNIRTSPLRSSQTPGTTDCFALVDQEEHDVLIWSIPPARRDEKGTRTTANPAGNSTGGSLGRRVQAPSKAPGVRMGGACRLHTVSPMLQSPGAWGWCELFTFIVFMSFF